MTARRSKPVADVLQKARELLGSPEKWGQGHDVHPKGRLDLILAIDAVDAFDRHKDAATEALWAAIPFSGGTDRLRTLIAFNDHPTRTHAHILALFDRAIDDSRPTDD